MAFSTFEFVNVGTPPTTAAHRKKVRSKLLSSRNFRAGSRGSQSFRLVSRSFCLVFRSFCLGSQSFCLASQSFRLGSQTFCLGSRPVGRCHPLDHLIPHQHLPKKKRPPFQTVSFASVYRTSDTGAICSKSFHQQLRRYFDFIFREL